jgi:hypothetical protein
MDYGAALASKKSKVAWSAPKQGHLGNAASYAWGAGADYFGARGFSGAEKWKRIAARSAVGLVGLGTAGRIISGNGGPVSDGSGRFDIAGLPFI